MPGTPMPFVKVQLFDDNGDPASGHLLFFYAAGTSTKQSTFSDEDLTVPHTNPLELDSAGRATIFWSPGESYKVVFAPPEDTDPPTSPIWTVDEVSSLSAFSANLDVEGPAGQTISINQGVYLSDGSGGLTAGRWYLTDADDAYSSSGAGIIGIAVSAAVAGETLTVRREGRVTTLSGLTVGATYFASASAGSLTSTAPTRAIAFGRADTTTSLILGANWGHATSTVRGLLAATSQSIGGLKTFNIQPQTYIGTATTLPATIGGGFFSDLTAHAIAASQTDAVLTDTEIPANMLSADGKAIIVRIAGSTAMTGTAAKTLKLDVGGTLISLKTFSSTDALWSAEAMVIRIDSDSVDVAWIAGSNTTAVAMLAQRINSLNFAAVIDLRSLVTTAAATTLTQTSFAIEAIG